MKLPEFLQSLIRTDTGIKLTAQMGERGRTLQVDACVRIAFSPETINALADFDVRSNLATFAQDNPNTVYSIRQATRSLAADELVVESGGMTSADLLKSIQTEATLEKLHLEAVKRNAPTNRDVVAADIGYKTANLKLQILKARMKKGII